MKRLSAYTVFVVALAFSLKAEPRVAPALTKIAFGSCLNQNAVQPIWEGALSVDPQVWVWLGDNIYGDTAEVAILAAKYAKLKANPGYSALRAKAQVIGTWDDHDFGKNDGGKGFGGKVGSQKAFLDFLDAPLDSPRRRQEGVYWSHLLGSGDREVRIMLLDCRYHRDDPGDIDGDILGEAQWAWLEEELKGSDARIHVIASGIQVIAEDHRYEKWMQLPKARRRLFDMVARTKAKGVIFLSGDRHIAEISKMKVEGVDYPLYDITSSSMTHAWASFKGEPNRHRIGEVYHENNFGLLEIDWKKSVVEATVRDETGVARRSVKIAF